MYSREEVKALTDKVIDMAKADAVEVEFSGGERSATRFANSNITAHMVQFDRSITLTVHYGNRSASATTREFDDLSLKQTVEDAQKRAQEAREDPEVLPLIEGPQDYMAVDAALPSTVDFGPADRAQMVKQSLGVCQKKGASARATFRRTIRRPAAQTRRGSLPMGGEEREEDANGHQRDL